MGTKKIYARSQRQTRYTKQTYSEAVASGQPVYWMEKPCRKGHIDFRRVNGGECINCTNAAVTQREAKKQHSVGVSRVDIDHLLETQQMQKELDYWE